MQSFFNPQDFFLLVLIVFLHLYYSLLKKQTKKCACVEKTWALRFCAFLCNSMLYSTFLFPYHPHFDSVSSFLSLSTFFRAFSHGPTFFANCFLASPAHPHRLCTFSPRIPLIAQRWPEIDKCFCRGALTRRTGRPEEPLRQTRHHLRWKHSDSLLSVTFACACFPFFFWTCSRFSSLLFFESALSRSSLVHEFYEHAHVFLGFLSLLNNFTVMTSSPWVVTIHPWWCTLGMLWRIIACGRPATSCGNYWHEHNNY